MSNTTLRDPFGRNFEYLRLSITDVCNFRCSYCLPDGYRKSCQHFLSLDETRRVVRAFSELGVWKLRITGGEPTLLPHLSEIIKQFANMPNIQHIALTTNGYKLKDKAKVLYESGLNAINISIDSLNADNFYRITGHKRLTEVLQGLDHCLELGFSQVKVNTVWLKDINEHELDEFIEFVRERPISLRFIELMRTNDNHEYFSKHHYCSSSIINKLVNDHWNTCPKSPGSGPAREYQKDGYLGKIGIIAPYSRDFCKSCNRLRVSATGKLHLCLFGEAGYDLRPLLQEDSQLVELKSQIMKLLSLKPESHFLNQNNSGNTPHLASIGG